MAGSSHSEPGRGLRPRSAWPLTVISDGPDRAWLVAGEDVRFQLEAPRLARWLAPLLDSCDGHTEASALLEQLDASDRGEAETLLLQLYEEGVLIDGAPPGRKLSHHYGPNDGEVEIESNGASGSGVEPKGSAGGAPQIVVHGSGPLADAFKATESVCRDADGRDAPLRQIHVFAQSRLDHRAVLTFNREALALKRTWIWVSAGPISRISISPLWLADSGPCAACLITHMRLRSPAPKLQSSLEHQPLAQPWCAPVAEVAPAALFAAAAFTHLKLRGLSAPVATPSLYDLHVLELGTLELTRHPVLVDPRCEACRRYPRPS